MANPAWRARGQINQGFGWQNWGGLKHPELLARHSPPLIHDDETEQVLAIMCQWETGVPELFDARTGLTFDRTSRIHPDDLRKLHDEWRLFEGHDDRVYQRKEPPHV